eukprot:364709-Chlamydomonas_euryale.AAC.1
MGGAVRAPGQAVFEEVRAARWRFFPASQTGTLPCATRTTAVRRALCHEHDRCPPCLVPRARPLSAVPCATLTRAVRPAAHADTAASGAERWVALDERRGVVFSGRGQLRAFVVPRARRLEVSRVRLRVTATASPRDANSLQLSSLNLYGDGAMPASLTAAEPKDASAEEAAAGFARAVACGGGCSGGPEGVLWLKVRAVGHTRKRGLQGAGNC